MNLLNLIKKHKIVSLILIFIIIALFSYFIFASKQEVQASYVTQKPQVQDFLVSITGSSQLSSLEEVDVTTKVEGELSAIYVIKGEEVKKGDILAKINDENYSRLVSEAYIDYETVKLELEELLNPTDSSSLVQAENSLTSEKESLVKTQLEQEENYDSKYEEIKKAETSLEESYEDAYNKIANVFLDFPGIITQIETLLYSYEISEEQEMFKQMNKSIFKTTFKTTNYTEQDIFNDILLDAEEGYIISEDKYEASFALYKDISRYSSKEEIETLLNDVIDAIRQTSDTLKSGTNMLDLWDQNRTGNGLEVFPSVSSYETQLKSSISTINSHLTNLLSILSEIKESKENIINLEKDIESMKITYPIAISQIKRSIQEKEITLADLQEGATDLEVRSKEMEVAQKLSTYNEALSNLNKCKIVAPFDGVIAEVNTSVNDDLSQGESIFTIVTNQKMIEIPLNEIDVINVSVGQKAIITFDAFEEKSFEGEVAELDVLGTVEQGVVSYNAKIIFDTDNESIKTGMTVNVEIIIYENEEALTIPMGAITTMREISSVEVLNSDGSIERRTVTLGESNDTVVEILEGLSETDNVIISKNQTTVTIKTTEPNSSGLLDSVTGGGMPSGGMPQGGGMMR